MPTVSTQTTVNLTSGQRLVISGNGTVDFVTGFKGFDGSSVFIKSQKEFGPVESLGGYVILKPVTNLAYTLEQTNKPVEYDPDLGSIVSLPDQSPVSGYRKNSRLPMRFAGGTTPSIGTQSVSTRILRVEAEAPFRRLRIHLFNADTTAATGAVKVAAAATDTLSEATATLRSQPHRAGVAYAALAADAGSPGWVIGAFAGAASAPMPQAASTYRHGVLSSDWWDISSVARTDVAGARPAALIRVQGDIKWTTYGNVTTDAGGLITAWRNNASAPWYRIYDMSTYAGDGIGDLAQNGGSISNAGLHCAIEFDYDMPGLSVLGIGDSLVENQYERGKYAPWGRLACDLVSSQSCPVTWANCGHAGQTADTFDPPGLDMIALLKPTHIFHQAYSPNPGAAAPSASRNALSMSRLGRTLAAAREVGARVCVWTPLANGAWDATGDAQRLALRQMLISRATAGEFDLLDIEGAMMSGATPARVNAAYDLDGTHINAAGIDVMAGLGAGYLRRFV